MVLGLERSLQQSVPWIPIGPPEGLGRIFRGGSYLNDPSYMRVSYRGFERPGNHMPVGFPNRKIR